MRNLNAIIAKIIARSCLKPSKSYYAKLIALFKLLHEGVIALIAFNYLPSLKAAGVTRQGFFSEQAHMV